MRLALLTLIVPDYDPAIAWFTGVLGWELLEDTDQGAKRWVRVGPPGGGCGILLARAATPEQHAMIGRQGGGRVWLFVETDRFEIEHARLIARGVVFEEAPRHEPYGIVAVFRDPWGNRWDLLEPSRPTR